MAEQNSRKSKHKRQGCIPGADEAGIYYNGRGEIKIEKRKIKCPFCGHGQKVQYVQDASCCGIFIKCQARHCRKEFEIKINQDK